MLQVISNKAIAEYQQIFKQEFGEEISFEEAKEQGIRLLRIFNIVYKPIQKSDLGQKI